MKHLYRIIFYSIVLIICLVMGVLGLTEKNRQYNSRKDELISIASLFNNSNYIKSYKENGVTINAKLTNYGISISYNGVNNYHYKFVLTNNYLYTTFDEGDPVANMFVMLIADSISQYYGESEGTIYNMFTSKEYLNLSLNDGIELETKNNKSFVKVNLDNPTKNK